jgi:hypothetical protein
MNTMDLVLLTLATLFAVKPLGRLVHMVFVTRKLNHQPSVHN